MSFFEDIQDPDTTKGKIAFTAMFLLVVLLLLTAAVSGSLLYRVVKPEARATGLEATDLPSRPEVVNFTVPGGKTREGWFFPGQITSPTIILCHGYQTHKADLITLVSALQKDQFNVFIFDFSGHGKVPGMTSLGPHEAKELQAAVTAMLARTDVDNTRIGLWGFDLGGYAAVSVALTDKRVKAIAVDSVFDTPRAMFELRARLSALSRYPLAMTFARWGYTILNWGSRNDTPLSERVGALRETSKLFIQGGDNPELAKSTLQLFLKSPEPRKQAVIPKSDYVRMLEDERKTYETDVVHFFREAFPLIIIR